MMKSRQTESERLSVRQQHGFFRWPSATGARRGRIIVRALLCSGCLLLLSFVPLKPFYTFMAVAFAHALPVRSEPVPNAILRVPPTQVVIWFDDALVPATSHLLVENAQGQSVTQQASYVNRANVHEMQLSLPRLAPGTYHVLWVAQSSDDGHVTEGAFLFTVASPHGTLPPGTGQGAAGFPTSSQQTLLTVPTLLQIVADWVVLLCMTLWVGGVFWETWLLSPMLAGEIALVAAATAASQRFRRLIPWLLGSIFIADVALLLSEALQLAHPWTGAFAPSLWEALVFGSQFGLFWTMRQGIIVLAVGLIALVQKRKWSSWRTRAMVQDSAHSPRSQDQSFVAQPFPSSVWRAWWEVLHGIPRLPTRFGEGWRNRSHVGQAEIVLGVAFLVAFALSGHATAVPNTILAYSLSVDLLHLVGNAVWIGGLLYIGVVLLPALRRLPIGQQAQVLALGVPQFSALALLSAVLLAATGSLNATVHLSSWQQLFTTLYGNVLVLKMEWFFLMAAISAYHAFALRPRLLYMLTKELPRAVAQMISLPLSPASGKALMTAHASGEGEQGQDAEQELSFATRRLMERMEAWLRREALLGAALLLCVALLSAFAGTVVPALAH